MKLKDRRHAGATIQRLMVETRELENFIQDRNKKHLNAWRAWHLLSCSWLLLEAARCELEEPLGDQHRRYAYTGIYR